MTRTMIATIGMATRWEAAWKAFSEAGQITWGSEGKTWILSLKIAAYEDWWRYHSLPDPCRRLLVAHWRVKLSLRRRWYRSPEHRELTKAWLAEINAQLAAKR